MKNEIRMPWVTLLLGAVSVLVFCAGSLVFDSLVWRADWIRSGEVWRLATGHLVHTSGSHLAWDIGAFLVLGSYVERQGRRGFLVLLGFAVLLTDFALRLGGRFEVYCGLSGLDLGLFAAAAFQLIAKGRTRGDCFMKWLGVGAFALVAGKVGFELFASRSIFVTDLESGFSVAVESHLAGLFAALLPKGIMAVRQLAVR